MTYNEIVVAKSGGVAFQVEVFSNRHFPLIVSFHIQKNPSGTGIEAQYVVDHTPHLRVYNPMGLAEHSSKVLPSPLKCATIARYAESHFSGNDGDRPRVKNIFRTAEKGL